MTQNLDKKTSPPFPFAKGLVKLSSLEYNNQKFSNRRYFMKKKPTILLALVLAILTAFFGVSGDDITSLTQESVISIQQTIADVPEEAILPEAESLLDPDGSYTTKEDVALYIHTYGCLPRNFMTKKEAQALGWEGGGLDDFAPGMCIGGDRFGNYEGLLPEDRDYTECDIDTLGASKRGAKRIVFSEDGLIYYTDNHYESFELLYGEP